MALSHLGQSPKDHVTLELVGGMSGGCQPGGFDFVRVTPAGGRSEEPFRVPEGRMLVVTDVDWRYSSEGLFVPTRVQTLRLFVENLSNATRQRAFESTISLVDCMGNAGFRGGTTQAMTAGFVLSSKARICVDVFPGPTGPPGGLQHLIVRGYVSSVT